MRKKFLFLMFVLMFAGSMAFAQESVSVAQSRNKQIHDLLDYRFRGGFYGFKALFLKTVKYTDIARTNCVIGIMVVSFQVDCDGTLHNIRIKNPLGFGLDKAISKFMEATKGHWNNCHNVKYTRFSVPFQFTMKGTQTDSLNAAISLLGKNPGYVCSGDNYYLRKAKEALAKRRSRKAKTYIETLIKRDPFNTDYYNMMEKALKDTRKGKKKKEKRKKKK